MRLLLLACAGGALGSGARFLVYQLFAGPARVAGVAAFPWGTLTVNVVGSFLMGLVVVVIGEKLGGSPEARTFFATGILGGFTTFSAFSLDALELYVNRTPLVAGGYIALSVIVSLLALVAGMAIARWILT